AMHAGIVKLNTLANTVRSGTQYDNLLAIGWFRFILILESGVVVRRLRGEFRRTSVEHFEYPADTALHTANVHVILAHVAKHPRDLQVRITFLLQGHKEFSGNIVKLIATKLCLQLYQFLYLHQEPLVDQGRLADRLQRHAQFKRVFHMEQAVAARMLQTFHNLFQVPALPSVRTETRPPDLQALAGFLQGLDKGAADAHYFADGLHLQAQLAVGTLELGKIPAGYLRDDVIQRRLEVRRRILGDLIF